MKKTLAFLAFLFLGGAAFAQGPPAREGQAVVQYDVDATALTYCVVSGFGNQGGPWDSSAIEVAPLIKTTGSSVTLDEVVAGSGPFAQVAVGDILVIRTQNPPLATVVAYRSVVTKASAAQITVDAAITLAGNAFGYFRNKCGTGADDGWFSVSSSASRLAMSIYFEQGDIATLAARFECKHGGLFGFPIVVYPGETSDCGIDGTLSTDRCVWANAVKGTPTATLTVLDDYPSYSACRVGLAYVTTDTSDATTTLEKVTVKISER